MQETFDEFDALLREAIADIQQEFFQLPVADADAVYRERVYCYELYHQLRTRWPFREFSLGGEVDKAGHPHFKDGPYSRAKPDLLCHAPGDMARNLCVIEVKPLGRPNPEYHADIMKLAWFCSSAGYHRGILLIYGSGVPPNLVLPPVAGSERLKLFHHRAVGATATDIQWLKPGAAV